MAVLPTVAAGFAAVVVRDELLVLLGAVCTGFEVMVLTLVVGLVLREAELLTSAGFEVCALLL